MNEVFYVLAPVFVLGLIGYSATRFRFFTSSHRDGLSKYVFDFAVPILLFSTVVELDPPVISATALFASYYIPLSAVFVLGLTDQLAFVEATGHRIDGHRTRLLSLQRGPARYPNHSPRSRGRGIFSTLFINLRTWNHNIYRIHPRN